MRTLAAAGAPWPAIHTSAVIGNDKFHDVMADAVAAVDDAGTAIRQRSESFWIAAKRAQKRSKSNIGRAIGDDAVTSSVRVTRPNIPPPTVRYRHRLDAVATHPVIAGGHRKSEHA